MQIFQQFGIQPVLLTAQIINFIILFALLKKFAYKPILSILDKRRQAIEEGLRKAEEGRLALEKAMQEEKRILHEASLDAKRIIADAKAQADELVKTTREKTKEDVERMLNTARKQIAQDAKIMEKQLAISTATLAANMLREAIKNVFGTREQEDIVQKMMKQMKEKN